MLLTDILNCTEDVAIFFLWGGGILLIINTLCIVRMPLLTMISGFFYRERENAKLVKNYLYPCIIFSIIEIASGHIFYQHFGWYTFGWAMWYLWALFWYQFITPILLNKCSIKQMLIISLLLAFIAGFSPLEYTFQLSRLVTFYPFYLIGILLQRYQTAIYDSNRQHIIWFAVFISIFIFTCILFHNYPSVRHYIDYAVPYSSYTSIIKRMIMYVICISASVSLILAANNRKYWFTKYGARTLDAYLPHMSLVVFPISFCFTIPFLHTWYGYAINLIGVPLICCLFYTNTWHRIMTIILLKKSYSLHSGNRESRMR